MQPADPCLLVIFGASGDLTSRKLIPSLYQMHCAGLLSGATQVLGVSRRPKSSEDWRGELKSVAQKHCPTFDDSKWAELAARIHYFAADAVKQADWEGLKREMGRLDESGKCRGNLLLFLSVGPELYEPIVEQIELAGLATEGKRWCSLNPADRSWQRIVVEKPFGHDEVSAASLNRALGRVFEEESIYRIDHYLGKEVVQSLLVLRFANSIFEPVWNHRYIDHVQITASESIGVEDRIGFYERTGALRDMIQSHMLQIMAFVAMEPPTNFSADHIRSEKIKAIDAVPVVSAASVPLCCALGQYSSGSGGAGYAELPGVAPQSMTETFAAIRLTVDNWRWARTPFYLRTGKRMAQKRTEVVVQFKPPAADLFRGVCPDDARLEGNRLVIEIAPLERTTLRFASKAPGAMRVAPVEMGVDYAKEFATATVEAYGPLLVDAMRGDQSLFKHRLEVEGAWKAVMPFLNEDSLEVRRAMHSNYEPGSWGPASSTELMARDGRAWHNPPKSSP